MTIMKKTMTVAALAASATFTNAAVIQTVAGPLVATGGGVGATIIDTASDTGDWIDTINAGGTIFIGFDWTIDNNAGETGGGGFFGGLGVYNGGTDRLLIGNGWDQLVYGGGKGAGGDDTSIAYVVGTTVRVVVELTTTNGGADNDTWKMWIDPGTGDLASPDAQKLDWTIDDITKITNRAGNTPGQATMENLVVADTFASAIPEPSSIALLGLGGLVIFRRRRG